MSATLPPSKLLLTTITVMTVTLGIKAAALVASVPGNDVLMGRAAHGLNAVTTARVIGQAQAAQSSASEVPPAPGSGGVAPDRPVEAARQAATGMTPEVNLRQSQIADREQLLTDREAALAAVDKHLTERVGELLAIQSRLELLEADRKTHQEANWAGLVKLYESMRPRDAASIFNGLDKPVLLEILDRMKAAKASSVIALMEPVSARQATQDLAVKRTNSTTLVNGAPNNIRTSP